jgi:carbonic anhydrase/acetyltransferase-like protein (isoleucine patch superfamily)
MPDASIIDNPAGTRPSSGVDQHVDPEKIERLGLRGRLLARLRGEQTLAQLRRAGLRAERPVRFSRGSYIDAAFAWAIEIGAHTILSTDVRIFAHDASIKRLTGYTEVAPVKIGKRCYLGAGVVVLPGSTIGDEAILGAGAVVRGEIPARSVAVGAPARVVTSTEELRRRHLDRMQTSPAIEQWPDQLDAAGLAALQRNLDRHGYAYAL